MLLFRPFSGQSCSCASALCDCFGDHGFDSLRFSITSVRTGRFPHPPEKTLGPITAFAGKLTSSIWQPMKRKFVRILVVVLAAFALFAFVYPDDLSENDTACGQSEILRKSSVRILTYRDRQAAHRDQQALAVDSTRLFVSNKITCSPTLLSLA